MNRQGDVYIHKVDNIEGDVIAQNNYVVAYGEVSGHKHRLTGDFTMYKNPKGLMFAEVHTEATLVHEEHAPHILKKGKYSIAIQREYDLVEGVRAVMD